jgi:hypothetical protein
LAGVAVCSMCKYKLFKSTLYLKVKTGKEYFRCMKYVRLHFIFA